MRNRRGERREVFIRCKLGGKREKEAFIIQEKTRQDEQVVNKEIKREFFSRCSLSREKAELYLSAQACV